MPSNAGLGTDAILKGPDGGHLDSQNGGDFFELCATNFQCCHVCFTRGETHGVDDGSPVVWFERQVGEGISPVSCCCRIDGPSGHASTPK